MRSLRRLFPLFLIIGVTASWAATASGAHPPHPTARDQAIGDGCLRSNFGTGFGTAPEWVYIDRNPTIRMAKGVVRIAHQSYGDSVLQHRSFDFNANLRPEPRYRWLIAGSPATKTNNYASDINDEEFARLHFEWESATLPYFAWPTDGDRATIWGSWIWDCGHWQTGSEVNTGGATTGEHSELHPLNGIAVQRFSPFLAKRRETQTDVFISNMGDGAHAVEQCALSHHPQPGASYPQYDAGFKPCAMDPANRIQPLAKSYKFFVPAPGHRPAGATLRYRMVNRIRGGSGRQRVRKLRNGIEVTVKVKGGKRVVRYGKTFFVSWSRPSPKPVKLKVTIKSILVKRADPEPSVPDPSGAHWVLNLNVNGRWQLLNKWAPNMSTHVTTGERFNINRTMKVSVPRNGRVWFQLSGLECDEPAGTTVFGIYANLLYPCPANTDERNPNILATFKNDDLGLVLDTYRSPRRALGKHTRTSAADTTKFPTSGKVNLGGFGSEGDGNYEVTYVVRRG